MQKKQNKEVKLFRFFLLFFLLIFPLGFLNPTQQKIPPNSMNQIQYPNTHIPKPPSTPHPTYNPSIPFPPSKQPQPSLPISTPKTPQTNPVTTQNLHSSTELKKPPSTEKLYSPTKGAVRIPSESPSQSPKAKRALIDDPKLQSVDERKAYPRKMTCPEEPRKLQPVDERKDYPRKNTAPVKRDELRASPTKLTPKEDSRPRTNTSPSPVNQTVRRTAPENSIPIKQNNSQDIHEKQAQSNSLPEAVFIPRIAKTHSQPVAREFQQSSSPSEKPFISSRDASPRVFYTSPYSNSPTSLSSQHQQPNPLNSQTPMSLHNSIPQNSVMNNSQNSQNNSQSSQNLKNYIFLVQHEGINQKIEISVFNLKELKLKFQFQLKIKNDFAIEYWDVDFQEFIRLKSLNEIPQEKYKLRIVVL